MKHADHVGLLRPADLARGERWADLGAGTGAFTLALRELVGADAEIFAIDQDAGSLEALRRAYRDRFGSDHGLHVVRADMARSNAEVPPLDGVLMANSLHFFKDKLAILAKVRQLLKPGGTLLLVEYNVDRGNMWVPHPLSFDTWRRLAPAAGFDEPRLLATHPSNFLREFYSAMAQRVDPAAAET